MSKQLIDLHVHTMYSLLDSNIRPKDLVQKLKDLGKAAIAITDHGNVHASTYMYKLLKQNGIKFIYGCEMYVCDDMQVKDSNNRYSHLLVLASSEQGRLNLNKLISASNIDGFYYKPRIDFKTLKQHKEGLIVLSACMGGEISKAILDKRYDVAKEIALKYKGEFEDDYYLEFQSHSDETQQFLNRQIVDLAKELNIDYVVTTDAHYLTQADQKYHSIFVQIGQAREVGETYNDCYIQTKDDVMKICKSTTMEENAIAIANTHIIADKCNVDIPLSAPVIPHVEIPHGYDSELDYLKQLCLDGWIKRRIDQLSLEKREEYKARLGYEMNAIAKMGFEGYYLLVHSYANIVKRRGIARGSGGGSLVAYLINIVDINPVKYGLYFERFIDVGAIERLEKGEITLQDVKIPDFDLDFGREDREIIVEALIEKYGRNKVTDLGVLQYIWAKGAIKDIGKVLGIPFDITNEMTKNLDQETIEEALELGLLSEYEDEYPELFDYAQHLSGLPKSFSIHSCGKVISMRDIDYYAPISINNGSYVMQGDMHDAESLGLVKIDVLGLRTVDIIYDTLDMIGKDYDYIDPSILDFEDRKVLGEFAKGNSITIFQFESFGMRDTLKKMQVSSLDDLGAANALYRPGSMQYIDLYVDRKSGAEKVEYLHPDLISILEVTYGIIVFQEQLIEVGQLAGMNNPDLLRQATGKKDLQLMAQVEPDLREGLYGRGWTELQVDTLWVDMVEFAKYSFNKSHSYAYAIIAYICQYLKIYHPTEYMCAVLNSYEGKIEAISKVLQEAKRMGIKIEFDYRHMQGLCHVRNGAIYYGSATIKGNNSETAEIIQQYQNIPYHYFVDLLQNIEEDHGLNKKIEILVDLGYFNSFYNTGKCATLYGEFTGGKHRYKRTHVEKTKIKRIEELRKLEEGLPNEKTNIKQTIKTEAEVLGVPLSTEPQLSFDYYMVIEFKTYNNKNRPYIMLYQLRTGKYVKTKVTDSKFFAMNKFELFDILHIRQFDTQKKSRQVNGKWQKTDEDEEVLTTWQVF